MKFAVVSVCSVLLVSVVNIGRVLLCVCVVELLEVGDIFTTVLLLKFIVAATVTAQTQTNTAAAKAYVL